MDVLFFALIVLCFLIGISYVRSCEALMRREHE